MKTAFPLYTCAGCSDLSALSPDTIDVCLSPQTVWLEVCQVCCLKNQPWLRYFSIFYFIGFKVKRTELLSSKSVWYREQLAPDAFTDCNFCVNSGWVLINLFFSSLPFLLSLLLVYRLFFKRFYLLIFREGRKRGRETSVCRYLSCGPHWGPGLQPRPVSWLGTERTTLWFAGQHSIPCHSIQGTCWLIFDWMLHVVNFIFLDAVNFLSFVLWLWWN